MGKETDPYEEMILKPKGYYELSDTKRKVVDVLLKSSMRLTKQELWKEAGDKLSEPLEIPD